jgi:hypothetical protein
MAWWSSIVGVVAEFGGFGLCDTALEVWGALGLDALNDGGLGVLATVGLGGIYSGVEGRTRLGGGEEGVGLVETVERESVIHLCLDTIILTFSVPLTTHLSVRRRWPLAHMCIMSWEV